MYMSVLFGCWNFDKKPIESERVRAANSMLSPYGPDRTSHYSGAGIVLVYHALHTNSESRREKQPFVTCAGAVITWDGRLDNREELVHNLGQSLADACTDVQIVGAAFDRWGTACFAGLLGDWAMAVWDERNRRLILAKDFLGVRPLYYAVDADHGRWSSVLDPLVLSSEKPFHLNEEYVAGWLALYPSADATPYVGIKAVPPCSFVTVTPQETTVIKHWNFDPSKRITYRTDTEYEEHFRTVFRQSVARRLRSDRPICCELSGGMDSPSVTSMADLIANSTAGTPEIYTLSYFDDSEPHADERRYFAKVEQKRGRIGCHIDLARNQIMDIDPVAGLWLTPARVSSKSNDAQRQRTAFLESHGIRVVLSGSGGDEMTGGVPTGMPELQDLIVQGRLRELAHKLKLWALAKRKPWIHLFAEALAGFLPAGLVPRLQRNSPAPWLEPDFVSRTQHVWGRIDTRTTFWGPLPTFQENIAALETLRRQISTNELSSEFPTDTRYPFLDRHFLEFMFAIPREQVIRPGFRRSLLRRALAGIVPAEVLERRRKAYASRKPRLAVIEAAFSGPGLAHRMETARLGIVNEQAFSKTLLAARDSDQIPFIGLARTMMLEAWLRNVQLQRLVIPHETNSDGARRPFPVSMSESSVS
jgi:asparagine synthase (glutamine-hydrolysing)